ncbi:hypothetical protein Tco_1335769 [Tanacetum coccineum]
MGSVVRHLYKLLHEVLRLWKELWRSKKLKWCKAALVSGQMTHFVASSTLDSAISCVMQGAFCTQRKVQFPVFTAGVPVRLLALAMAAVCASRAAVKSAVSCRMASKVMAGVSDVDVLLGGILSTKDNTEIMMQMVEMMMKERYVGNKNYEINSSDGGNIGDRVKIAVEYRIWVIGIGGIILSVEFSEELKEMIPDEAGKNNRYGRNIIVIVNSIITLNSCITIKADKELLRDYWRILPKEILGDITHKRISGDITRKRYWEILPKRY